MAALQINGQKIDIDDWIVRGTGGIITDGFAVNGSVAYQPEVRDFVEPAGGYNCDSYDWQNYFYATPYYLYFNYYKGSSRDSIILIQAAVYTWFDGITTAGAVGYAIEIEDDGWHTIASGSHTYNNDPDSDTFNAQDAAQVNFVSAEYNAADLNNLGNHAIRLMMDADDGGANVIRMKCVHFAIIKDITLKNVRY